MHTPIAIKLYYRIVLLKTNTDTDKKKLKKKNKFCNKKINCLFQLINLVNRRCDRRPLLHIGPGWGRPNIFWVILNAANA